MAKQTDQRVGLGHGVLGRQRELTVLLQTLEEAGPRVIFVHGIAGVGKSTLLEAFAAQARAGGTAVLSLDGRDVEPTERGFLGELGRAVGSSTPGLAAAARRLGDLAPRVVVAIDAYEVLRLLDPWLRRAFLPGLPPNARMVVASREPPAAAWLATEGFRALALGPLPSEAAEEVLVRAGMTPDEAARVNRLVRGYPLGLAVAATTETLNVDVAEAAAQRVVEELTRVYLEGLDAPTRRALDAASVVRRVTLSALAAMLPDAAPQDAYDRLRDLAFVEIRPDGLMVHEAIQQASAALLRAADPESQRRYRRAAWRTLRFQLRRAPPHELWRYTADMLYLIENPVVREAFFPAGSHPVTVEPARPEDAEPIAAIARLHEPPAAAGLVEEWWRRAPEAFFAVRDGQDTVVGFSCVLTPRMVTQQLVRQDPVAGRWWEHLRAEPIPKGQTVLFHRWWLSRDLGEARSPVQAATWLDLKRLYMELRPHLRRVYGVVRALDSYFPTFRKLGFEPLPGDPVEIDGVPNYCAVLDFGPASVDGWLTCLAASELGVEDEGVLDVEQRELVLDSGRVPLTTLEFEVMRYLSEREGKPVPRADLLRDVWGYDFQGTSNVVDVVVRSLRKKLGQRAGTIETVRSIGYRFRREH